MPIESNGITLNVEQQRRFVEITESRGITPAFANVSKDVYALVQDDEGNVTFELLNDAGGTVNRWSLD